MSHRLCALVLLPLFLIPLAAADRYTGLDTAKFLLAQGKIDAVSAPDVYKKGVNASYAAAAGQ